MPAETVVNVLRAHDFSPLSTAGEASLQDAIAQLLYERDVYFRREVRLGPYDRIDFVCWEGVGIEVKIKGSWAALTRQLARYAQHESIAALVVVTTRARLSGLPAHLCGVPIHVVSLLERGL